MINYSRTPFIFAFALLFERPLLQFCWSACGNRCAALNGADGYNFNARSLTGH